MVHHFFKSQFNNTLVTFTQIAICCKLLRDNEIDFDNSCQFRKPSALVYAIKLFINDFPICTLNMTHPKQLTFCLLFLLIYRFWESVFPVKYNVIVMHSLLYFMKIELDSMFIDKEEIPTYTKSTLNYSAQIPIYCTWPIMRIYSLDERPPYFICRPTCNIELCLVML